jgi:hypothetical protein
MNSKQPRVLGLLAIAYGMVGFVRERIGGEEWILGVGFCLLVGAAGVALVHGALLDFSSRIQALEKRTAADVTRPAAG